MLGAVARPTTAFFREISHLAFSTEILKVDRARLFQIGRRGARSQIAQISLFF
jgi:hypothetical protein